MTDRDPPARHSQVRAIGANSIIFTGAAILQRGASFLLLPLYTQLLTPGDYGTLAIVTAINGFLVTLFSLCLHSSMARFYLEYCDEPPRLRDFWGTVLTLITLVSVGGCVLLLLTGEMLLAPLLGTVQFWPYVALGVVATMFQPFIATYLGILQIRGEARRYAWFSFGNFLLTTVLTLALIWLAGWRAAGPLTAALVAAAVFAGLALYSLRGQFRVTCQREYAREALAYSLPQLPHSLSSQFMAATDRFMINHYIGRATTGIYNVGAMFGLIVDVIGQGLNRAYVPLSMDVLKKRDPEGMAHLKEVGLVFVVLLALLASGLTLFAREAVNLLTAPEFASAFIVVPFIAFAGAVSGTYYVLINVLFYDVKAIRYLPIATFASALLNVALNFALVPRLGVIGAGAAALCAQIFTAGLVGFIGRRFDPIHWPYGRFALIYLVCFAVSAGFHRLESGSPLLDVAVKSLAYLALVLFLGRWLWNDSRRLPRMALSALSRMARVLRSNRA